MKKGMSPRLALVVIASMFIFPLALAWLMYSGVIDFDPAQTRNRGALVEPPVPVPLDEFQWTGDAEGKADEISGHWLVLYAVPGACDDTCLETAAGLRQVHRAAGRNQSRLRLLALGEDTTEAGRKLAAISPDFLRATSGGASMDAALRGIAQDHASHSAGSVYLIDPLGNIMLFYADGFDPNDLKKDLKRLLTWSKLDEQ